MKTDLSIKEMIPRRSMPFGVNNSGRLCFAIALFQILHYDHDMKSLKAHTSNRSRTLSLLKYTLQCLNERIPCEEVIESLVQQLNIKLNENYYSAELFMRMFTNIQEVTGKFDDLFDFNMRVGDSVHTANTLKLSMTSNIEIHLELLIANTLEK